ncbi:hypothetical protein N5D_26660 [Enterococcus faecalis]|nr:hypothetical protein N5D_26660 [Enterococcus faecalis]
MACLVRISGVEETEKNKHEEAERYLNLAQQMKNVESGNL